LPAQPTPHTFLGLVRSPRRCGWATEAYGCGFDVYILSWIILDWDDGRSVTILKNCRRAMPPGSS
jgi:hypothetical protein